MARVSGTAVRRKRSIRGPAVQKPAGRRPARFVTLTVLACAILSALVMAEGLANEGEIRAGVSAGSIDLGGRTSGEARAALSRLAPDGKEIRLKGPEGGLILHSGALGARLDVQTTVGRAYAVGRQGGAIRRLAERALAPFGIEVPAEVRYRSRVALEQAGEVAARVDRGPRDAALDISEDRVRVTPSEKGYRLDPGATAANLGRALEDLSGTTEMSGTVLRPGITTAEAEAVAGQAREALSGPLVLTAGGRRWTVPAEGVGSALVVSGRDGGLKLSLDRERLRELMAPMYDDLTVEPVEAGYEVGSGATPEITVTPAREGRAIREAELFDAIAGGVFEGRREYPVTVVVDGPDLTTARAESLKPTELLGSYRTDYSVVPDDGTRVENLGISSGAVNGTMLAPGGTFSMLEHVAGLDYNDSKVIVGGEEVNADGGGLCQVTSTLYNAANFAGLDVIERTPHSSQLPYIRPGMDATVWWGGPGTQDDLDMKFRNTTGGYLLLREYVSEDGHVYAEIWGRPSGTEVQMHSEPTYMGAGGSDWVTYQTVERNGEVVFDGVLHEDSYEPLEDYEGNTIPPSDVPVAPVDP